MLPETERMLREFYAPYNAELGRLLGRPMGWGEVPLPDGQPQDETR